MTFYIEYFDEFEGEVSYEATTDDLIKALAKCMVKHAGGELTKDNIQLFIKIISDLNLVYDDDILEYFAEDIETEFTMNYKEYL